MKKYLFLALMAVCTCAGLCACGDDDDDNVENGDNTSATWEKGRWLKSQLQVLIDGQWVLLHKDYNYELEGNDDGDFPGYEFDGKGKAYLLDYDDNHAIVPLYFAYNYTTNGDKLYLDMVSGIAEFYYDREQNVLAKEEIMDGHPLRLTFRKR